MEPGGWAVEVGAEEEASSVTQLKARTRPRTRPGHITTILLHYSHYSQPRPRRWDTGHTLPPAPSHHDVVTPDIG